MKIALFGYGKNSQELAKRVPKNELTVIAIRKENFEKVKKDGYLNVEFLPDITDDELTRVGIEGFDVAMCMVEDEATNLFLTLSIRTLNKTIKIIAKAENREYRHRYTLAGVNKIINPYEIAANRMETMLRKPLTLKVINEIIFSSNNFSFYGLEVLGGSFLENKYVKDLDMDVYNVILLGLLDYELGGEFHFLTRGYNHKIDAGDVLFMVGSRDEIERLKQDMEPLR